MMFGTCSCGIYLLERYRRNLFVNARHIDAQNAQLEKLVGELELTVSRKTALLKMFAHVMKTPVHQIVGFLQLARTQPGPAHVSTSIGYAEEAAADLRKKVEEMVDYHYAENSAPPGPCEKINVKDALEEFFYRQIDAGSVKLTGGRMFVESDQQLLWLALKQLEIHFRDRNPALTEISCASHASGHVVDFVDEGPGLSEADFNSKVCQLSAFDNYLSGEGANPEMPLRIAARAVEKLGGAVSRLDGGRSGLRITLPLRMSAAA
jgi:signal transduction histidine kinase